MSSLSTTPAPANFTYPEDFRMRRKSGGVTLTRPGGSADFQILNNRVIRIAADLSGTARPQLSQAGIEQKPAPYVRVHMEKDRAVCLSDRLEVIVHAGTGAFEIKLDGAPVLQSAKHPFGFCGSKSLVVLDYETKAPVYGLGEKSGGLDKSGRAWRMINIDVVGEYPHSFHRDDFDPSYVSIPFVVSRRENAWFGMLLDNPWPSFAHAGFSRGQERLFHPSAGLADDQNAILTLGADDGPCDVYLIPGPSLPEVIRGFARLTGCPEMPPLWALGYHQCRWSYETLRELEETAKRLAEERIPVGAMWMDIDYMDGFRVFTWNNKTFPEKKRRRVFEKIRARGTRLVTIVDPGVKSDPKYSAYRQGLRQNAFCKTPEGGVFYGTVWPGRTAFPDFSTSAGCRYWKRLLKNWFKEGIEGIWNDMNDPSMGPISSDEMCFENGKTPHGAYHNQYAHLMAKTTQEAFHEHDSDSRPFILTRSGYTGTQKHAAIWTGDNFSNVEHLRMSVPMSLNLALSGVSFNGPDVGGFAGDTTEELITTWMLAGAMFPFFRNHSSKDSLHQEPYAFRRRTLDIIRRCINTRCKLLPYIYTQFHLHRRDGDPVMRPVVYEFPGRAYEQIDGQYFIGPSLMAAPFLDPAAKSRKVVLPPGWWFSLEAGTWIRGGRTIPVARTDRMMLFVRDGSILPCLPGTDFFPQPDFSTIEFHVFARSAGAAGLYYEDDRETRRYLRGEYNIVNVEAVLAGRGLVLTAERGIFGYEAGIARSRFYCYGRTPAGARPARVKWPFGAFSTAAADLAVEFD